MSIFLTSSLLKKSRQYLSKKYSRYLVYTLQSIKSKESLCTSSYTVVDSITLCRQFHVRAFNSQNLENKNEKQDGNVPQVDEKERKLSFWQRWIFPIFQPSSYTPRVLIIGGSSIAAISITRVMYGLTNTFLSLTPAASMYYGFLGGILATGTAASLIYIGELSFRLHPDRAVAASMTAIHKNKELLASALGSHLKSGRVHTYTSKGGGFGLRPSGSTSSLPIVWNHPEIQLFYIVQGSKAEGAVSVVYSKHGLLSEVTDFVAVDFLNAAGSPQQITLVGDGAKFELKALMRRSFYEKHAALILAPK